MYVYNMVTGVNGVVLQFKHSFATDTSTEMKQNPSFYMTPIYLMDFQRMMGRYFRLYQLSKVVR